VRTFAAPGFTVKTFFSYLLISLVLLQTFSREVLVVDFTLHQATITARFCVNKARPQLHCDGKCYFAKQLKKQEDRESKSASPLKERLEMLGQHARRLRPLSVGVGADQRQSGRLSPSASLELSTF
jgi:hypothetical protein